MKKFLSLALAVILAVSLFTAFPPFEVSTSAAVTISKFSPAVTGNAGTSISLSGYQVELNDGTVLKAPTWTYNGSTVTSVKFDTKGVYSLTASEGNKSRTVYAVIKNPADTEYVLYENDFNEASDLNDLTRASGNAEAVIKDGKLVLNSTGKSNTIYLLPKWLGDFGNYNLETKAAMISSTDASRWFSIVFRHSSSKYMHMCVRKNMAAAGSATSGGIECVLYNGGWKYLDTTSYTSAMNYGTYYTFGVSLYNNALQYTVDGFPVIHMDDMTKNPYNITGMPDKGNVGLQGNSSEMRFDYIKVTVSETAPTYDSSVKDPLIAAEHESTNLLNSVSNVAVVSESETKAVIEASVNPDSVLVKYDGAITAAKLDELKALCKENSVVMGVFVKNTTDADAVIGLCAKNNFWYINIASEDGEVLQAIRKNRSSLRTILVVDSIDGKTAQQMRETVRKYAVNVLMIPLKDADKATVQALQELHLTVWVNGENMSKTDIAFAISAGAHAVVSDDYNLVYTVMKEVYGKNTLTKTPSIIGHRGNPSQAPENSISGYITAINNGATEVECDIYLTADKEIIIMHDNTLNRTTNYTGNKAVTAMTLSEIKQYYLKDNSGKVTTEKVPTLIEFFEALKDYDVYYVIELKSGDQAMVKPLYDLIKQYNVQDRVNIISFAGDVLNTTYSTDPIISAGYLGGSLKYNDKHAFVEEYHQSVFDLINGAQSFNATVNVNYAKTSAVFYQLLNDRGITLWPWTYGQKDVNMYHGFLAGFDGLTTDYAQYMKDNAMDFNADKVGTNLLRAGQTMKISSTVTTYGKVDKDVSNDVGVVWIENDIGATFDAASGTFKADKAGTVSFMLNYTAKLPANATDSNYAQAEYVLYTQPITVKVYEGDYPENTLGDLNENGKVDTSDILALKYMITGVDVKLPADADIIADVNCDGKVNTTDYLALKYHLLNINTVAGWAE